jgi:hypothetical protein
MADSGRYRKEAGAPAPAESAGADRVTEKSRDKRRVANKILSRCTAIIEAV